MQTFREAADVYPQIRELSETLSTLEFLSKISLTIGADGRNRTLLAPFGSVTSRNQPSTTKGIFGLATWLRSLMKPPPGQALVYLDWEQQEFGIAAIKSGDEAMRQAYESRDPYLYFAHMAGAVPAWATKETHGAVRDLYKRCALGVQYAMGVATLAAYIGCSTSEAQRLLRHHKRTFAQYWHWNDRVLDYATLTGAIHTCGGWTLHVEAHTKPGTIRNFQMQAHGAEMLRLACMNMIEHGILLCMPIHDALLIQAPLVDLADHVTVAKACMADASSAILDGFALRTEEKIVPYPERFVDKRGKATWNTIWDIIGVATYKIE